MTGSASSYNLAVVHELLTAAFSAEELCRFCRDHPQFRDILDNFGPNYSLNQMADKVIDYCRIYRLFDELLEAIQEENPRQYDRFRDRLHAADSGTLSSPRTTSEPLPKRLLSRPIVWVVIAAVVLVGGYWLLIYDPSPEPPPVVALKTTHNRYVGAMGADRDWVLMAETEVIDDYEEFALRCQDDDTVVLQTWHRTAEGKPRYVTPLGADRDWVLIGETDAILDWEKFTFLNAHTGKEQRCLEVVESLKDDGEVMIALQTCHKNDGKHRLVTAMDGAWGWVLRAETTELKASERFTVILLRYALE
jgi:hypothetical protein